jgi:transcriptional regulator with XRE-family HTH domain
METMAKTSSAPIVPRWYIGRTLKELRIAKGLKVGDTAKLIGQSIDTARRLEAGEVGIVRGTLTLLLDAYEADEKTRSDLLDLQESARQRGWWVPYGPVGDASFSLLLGVESAATKLQWFNHYSIPGFLQTAEYATALMAGTEPDGPPDRVKRAAEMRPVRYEKIFAEDPVEEAIVIVDEMVLRRQVGGSDVMRTQLQRLLDAPCELRVVPVDAGPYPGTVTFGIFHFGTESFGPVAYVEGIRGGQMILDDEEDVAVFRACFERIQDVAMTPEESRAFVAGRI